MVSSALFFAACSSAPAPHGFKAQLDQAIRKQHKDLKYCFDHESHQYAEVEGRVTLEFLVTQAGKATHFKVDRKASSLRNNRVERCLANVLQDTDLPKPPGGKEVLIHYPFAVMK